nr:MAG TPA: hypothetical protein [Caudoviricetes sp.]
MLIISLMSIKMEYQSFRKIIMIRISLLIIF